jgi:lipopolysaccharide export LptBFGC system permease protein LptF
MGPLLTLAAAMFTLTTLTRQNELAPLKAAGISIYRILLPIFVLAALLAAFGFFLQERVIPRFKDPIRSALALARARPLNPAPYKDTEHGYLIRVAEYSTTRKIAHDVEIFETYENVVSKRLICANQMEWIAAGSDSDDERGRWVLHDGSIQEWDSSGDLKINPSGSKAQRLITSFKRMELESSMRPIDLETGDMENSEISYLSSHELRAQYQRNPENHLLAVRLHHHFAFPFAHLILLLLGIPFVLHVRNRSTFISMASCFLIAALYFLVDSLSMHIANSQLFSPILAAWLPVMLFGSLGITLFDNLPS